MATLGGIDLSGILQAAKQGVGDLVSSFTPETDNPALGGLGGQRGPDLWQGLQYAPQPTAYQVQPTDPMMGYQAPAAEPFAPLYGDTDLFANLSYGSGTNWGGIGQGPDLFADFRAAKGRADQADEAERARQAAQAAIAPGGGTGGGNTGADGAAAWVQSQALASSPIIAIADDIARYAISRNVDPGLIFGKLRAESSWATNGQGPAMNNPGNIMAPGADPANGVIILRQYGSMLDGVKAMVDLLASYHQQYGPMFGKAQLSTEDLVAIYYVGPEAYKRYGLNANDAGGQGPGGNGTVQDYLNRHVYPIVQSYNGRPGARKPTTTANGGSALASMFGGAQFTISQGFGHTDYSDGPGKAEYDWGTEVGLDGDEHPGWDIAIPRGSAFYMPQGLSGTVFEAGGTGFYTSTGGDAPGRGELEIHLDNGMILILGHNDRINVNKGDRVTAGMLLGLTGSSGGDHLHIELRQRDPSTRSGWRVVDPSVLFGGQ